MYVVTGRIKARSSFADVAKLLETGLGPIVRRARGFRGYYLVDTGERTGEGVLVFEAADDYSAIRNAVTAWFETNIGPLCEGAASVTAGEVVAALEADGAPAPGRPASGAEARPH